MEIVTDAVHQNTNNNPHHIHRSDIYLDVIMSPTTTPQQPTHPPRQSQYNSQNNIEVEQQTQLKYRKKNTLLTPIRHKQSYMTLIYKNSTIQVEVNLKAKYCYKILQNTHLYNPTFTGQQQ